MSVSQNNNGRLILAILFGFLMTSGCSGHSVKYGTNSEGEGTGAEEEMNETVAGASKGITYNADGTPVHGGMVDGTNAYLRSSQDMSNTPGEMQSAMAAIDGTAMVPGSADYGRQFDGVDGTGPNQGGVTGFGSGSAGASQPDPEAWANAYLREKRSSQEFYGDPSRAGSSNDNGAGSSNDSGAAGETFQYGHDYAGVPGSGPNYGDVDGFSQGSASQTESNPEAWAQAYVQENGGPSPEYVNPDTGIAHANGNADTLSMGTRDSSGELREIRNTNSGVVGRVQDIYFAFDSWSISTVGAKYLEEDAQWLHANPGKALTIEGHCDQRGTQDYNLVLGKKRAEAAQEYLVNLGVQPHRIKIVSYGKERPFCRNNNENCFQENRRNHMVVRLNQS